MHHLERRKGSTATTGAGAGPGEHLSQAGLWALTGRDHAFLSEKLDLGGGPFPPVSCTAFLLSPWIWPSLSPPPEKQWGSEGGWSSWRAEARQRVGRSPPAGEELGTTFRQEFTKMSRWRSGGQCRDGSAVRRAGETAPAPAPERTGRRLGSNTAVNSLCKYL